MTPSIAMGERAVPVLMRATAGHCDGHIDLLVQPCSNPARTLPPSDVRVVSTKALEMFVDKKRQAEFEREVGKVQPLSRDKFLYLLRFMAALEQGGPDSIERVIRGGIEQKHLTEKALADPLKKLGQLLNFGVKDVVFAIWWSDKEKRFAPGLFCPNAITALHVLALTWAGKRGGIAACARCGTSFIKSRKKQVYCSALCENAGARARSREKSMDLKPTPSVLPERIPPLADHTWLRAACPRTCIREVFWTATPADVDRCGELLLCRQC